MADKRINALANTAPSTASDDFIAVDGTTNGTRKLNAFSPTFGGNATVTGTLTVNGAGGSIGGQWKITNATIPDVWLQNTSGATSAYRNILIRQNSDDTFKFLSTSDAGVLSKDNILTGSNANGAIGIGVTPAAGASSLTVAGVIKTNDTTASTTTSTGALVVGNGTSGGLGVGGDANIGGSLTVTGASNGIICNGAGLSLNTAGSASVRFQDAGVSKWWIYKLSGDPWLYFRDMVNGRMQLQMVPGATSGTATSTFNSNLEVTSTAASTSTSSGALVVSGGVGVAGAIYGGGDIISSGNGNIQGGRFTSVNSNSYIEQSGTDFTYVTGGSRPHVFSIGGTTRFQVTTSGIISSLPASAASLTVNSTMTFELTSNTSLKIFVRGSDGTTRSTTLTLA